MNGQETRLTGDIKEALEALAAGAVVAVPTETVYGLAGDATQARAVAAIYAAKARPQFNPLIAHVAEIEDVWRHIRPSAALEKLAADFWPGPLTLLGPAQAASSIVPLARAGLAQQAMRVPSHPVMRDLLSAYGKPLAAPSANASGRISPTQPAHVLASLGGRIPLILDGGTCIHGLESTVIGFEGEVPVLLRAGAIPPEAIAHSLGRMPEATFSGTVQSPGQMASHYAPRLPLALEVMNAAPGQFLIGFGSVGGDLNLSLRKDLVEAAANLFDFLYQADASGAARIGVAPIPAVGLGLAINDRLRRAAAI